MNLLNKSMKMFIYLTLLVFLGISSQVMADAIKEGKTLTFERKKGNCLACHQIEDGELAGTAGPPLIAMKARFPDKKDIFDKIWDATKNDPHSFMPPFGKHGILTKDEINLIVEYLYTL